ncbi:MAG: hypothetical protein GXO93_09050 [FCB group bacterium]|nr:hypothetical protein [FCB group bacterium]
MYIILLATLLSLPLYPLNPTTQDTINYMNLHITAGIDSPSGVVSMGPEVSIKYEMVLQHPFIFRTAFDYRYGTINNRVYPKGKLQRIILSTEALYYRGTNKLTGYLGGGIVYAMDFFNLSDHAGDSLFEKEQVTDVSIDNVPGYRITTGLRIHKVYSIEVNITETYPSFVFFKRYSSINYSFYKKKFRLNDFRVSLGYLFTLKM